MKGSDQLQRAFYQLGLTGKGLHVIVGHNHGIALVPHGAEEVREPFHAETVAGGEPLLQTFPVSVVDGGV